MIFGCPFQKITKNAQKADIDLKVVNEEKEHLKKKLDLLNPKAKELQLKRWKQWSPLTSFQ